VLFNKISRAAKAKMRYDIEVMQPADWEQVSAIYLEGIETGNATFETETPDWERWDANHLSDCRLVARANNRVIGWAAVNPVSKRRVYAGVAEVSIYISEGLRGQGIGQTLLEALIACSEKHGIWTLQAGIFPENVASLLIHQRCGFREVGRRASLGRHYGKWRDVILLERRSKLVGTE
jgi:L-amino acid N-acyltransferase YncA